MTTLEFRFPGFSLLQFKVEKPETSRNPKPTLDPYTPNIGHYYERFAPGSGNSLGFRTSLGTAPVQ